MSDFTMHTHKVLVFHKLESFRGAALKVKYLLEDLKLEGVDIGDYSAAYKEWASVEPITVVVVIDARQTRTLITPERRDANVDHWTELNDISNNVTDSILLVVYGDDNTKSSKLEDNKTIARNWLTTWKFNDDIAYKLAEKKRCFTIWDSFNGAQKSQIENFIKISPSVPQLAYESNVLQLGNDGGELDKCVREHPFVYAVNEVGEDGNTVKRTYAKINFQHPRPTTCKPTSQVYVNKAFPLINVCQTINPTASLKRQLSATNLKLHGVMEKNPAVVIDHVILTCHCKECYLIVHQHREQITNVVKNELGTVGVTLVGDVFPWPAEDHESVVLVMESKIRERGGSLPFDGKEIPGDAKVKHYVWHMLLHLTAAERQMRNAIKRDNPNKKLVFFLLITLVLIMWIRSRSYVTCQHIQCDYKVDLVCGNDGVTYINECQLSLIACQHQAVVTVVLDGACQYTSYLCDQIECDDEPGPVCGSDGVTYANKCQFRLKACQDQRDTFVLHSGYCRDTETVHGDEAKKNKFGHDGL